MTRATLGTSMPREATSVATSMSALPWRNFDMDISRLCWVMSPSITTELYSLLSMSATSRVLYFVEQNTMHCPPLFSLMN